MAEHAGKAEEEILRLEEEFRQAEMRLDREALDRIFADDVMFTAPTGIVVDKPALWEEVREAGKAVIERFEKEDMRVRAYGETAVTSYRLAARARYESREVDRLLRVTDVWVKRGGRWQVAARHTADLQRQQAAGTT